MVALPVFDVVLSADLSSARSGRIATQLVESALSELTQIEKLDDSLAPEDPTQFDRRMATLLRDMYERFADDAESLLERIERIEQSGSAVRGAELLRHAHGKTRARLTISVDDMERSIRALAEGRLIPAEEVRRELRLRAH